MARRSRGRKHMMRGKGRKGATVRTTMNTPFGRTGGRKRKGRV